MAYFLGVDTGGTYTDAVILDEAADRVIGKAKSLTTRGDLALGIGRAVDAALDLAGVAPEDIALVSLSTTLATNALVEGQGGRVALICIGFDDDDLMRGGLSEALKGDPVIRIAGGHSHAGTQSLPLDLAALETAVAEIGPQVMGFAVAARFATRNSAHEIAARDLIRRIAQRPVTCSHELSAKLNGPKRALTAVLNARLIGMIDGLVAACERHLVAKGISAPLMVVRGDGALISAAMVRERPIETILSGPAASIVGARWLTGEKDALVSDIGGTTTDVAILKDGLPEIDPDGARVGGFRTMVEAVAMRTTGLGGDSEVHLVTEGLVGGLRLGPRRLIPVSLLAVDHAKMVHETLDRLLSNDAVTEFDGRFVVPMTGSMSMSGSMSGRACGEAAGLTPREAAVLARVTAPMPLSAALTSRLEVAAMERLVARGLVMISGVTPSDAAHVLGRQQGWDGEAALKAVTLLAKRRTGAGERFATGADPLSLQIIDQLTEQTADCLLEAAFAEDQIGTDAPEAMARHPLTVAGIAQHRGILALSARLAVPVIGLGASAPTYYGAVGEKLGCPMILPEHAGVANAIGAVVGQISQRATGQITSPAEGIFTLHLPEGLQQFAEREQALTAMEAYLTEQASTRARASGAEDLRLVVTRDIRSAQVEGQSMFIEAVLSVTASGRPRVAHAAKNPLDAPLAL